MILFMYKIRHCKIVKRFPILIGTIPLYFPPSAPSLHNVTSNPSISYTKESMIMPVPTPTSTSEQSNASYLPAADQRRSVSFVVPEQPSSSSINMDIRKKFINNLYLIYRKENGVTSNYPSFFFFYLAPPSYEESMSGTQDIRDENESEYVFGANTPFTPRYPVFNNYPALSKIRIHYETIKVVLILQ